MKSVASSPDNDDDDDEGYDDEPDSSSGAYTPKTATRTTASTGGDLLDLMDDTPATPPGASNCKAQFVPILSPENGKGIGIQGCMVNRNGKISLMMEVTNTTATPTAALAIQLNKNGWGVAPVSPQMPLPMAISNGSSCSVQVDLKIEAPSQQMEPGLTIQTAIKNMASNDVCYFPMPIMVEAIFTPGVSIDAHAFAGQWKSMGETNESSVIVNNVPTTETAVVKEIFASNNLAFIADRQIPNTDQTAVYFAAKTAFPDVTYLVEVKFKAGASICKVTVKSPNTTLSNVIKTAVARIVGPK